MKIKVRSGNIKLWFPIPTAIVFSDLTALFLPKMMEQSDVTITREQARKWMRELRKCMRRHRGLTLVEAQSTNGEWVEIKL